MKWLTEITKYKFWNKSQTSELELQKLLGDGSLNKENFLTYLTT